MKSFYLTDAGIVRDHNEDSVIISKNISGQHLMLVADGMGGHRAGEVASSMVVTHFGKAWSNVTQIRDVESAVNWVKNQIDEINDSIYHYAVVNPECHGMGTTCVLAIIADDYIIVANAGDSRAYQLTNQMIEQVSIDHTLVNALYLQGELTKEEALVHPKRNVLMRALGTYETIDVDVFEVDRNVDGILLCSDGLTNMLFQDEIKDIIYSNRTIENKVNELVIQANHRGGVDNISVALMEFGGDE
jgi:protein phosphatase